MAADVNSKQAITHAQLEALLDAAPDFIMFLDRDGLIQFINRVLPQYTRESVIGTHWTPYIFPEQHAVMAQALESVLASGTPTTHESATQGPDGDSIWFSTQIAPVRLQGKIVGAVLIARDITAQKHTQSQLFAADRLMAVGTLAAGVGHEINNPLAAVIANLDLALTEVALLAEKGAPSDLVEELEDARDGAERIRTIIRDLKVFSRASEDQSGPVDARRILESTLRMSSNEIRHRARLVKRLHTLPPVAANEARLGQVFLNLIVNAAQSIPEGRAEANEICVTTNVTPTGEILVEVSDTGAGMSTETQKRLFTPFFTTKPIGEGTGLGLSICHRLVAQMGGRIVVESELGRGSVFRVYLPAANAEVAVPLTPSLRPRPERRGQVLVVDDEPSLGRVVGRILASEHDVTVCITARQALTLFESGGVFDVILCDLMMPDITGAEFHTQLMLKSPEAAARVIFMTGGAFTSPARAFLDQIPNLRIDKPFDSQQLSNLVNDRLRARPEAPQ
jgi:PAS domain S-box-containing protein